MNNLNDIDNLNNLNDIDNSDINLDFSHNTHDTHSICDTNNTNTHTDEDKQKKFKYGLFLLNNGWNDKNESLLSTIGTNAQIYKKVHTQVHQQYKIINYIYGILLVLLNAGLFIQAFFYSTSIELFPSSQKSLLFLSTVLTFFYNFIRLGEKKTNHSQSSKAFSELYHDNQNQMCMYRKDRSNAMKYVFRILKRYDHLVISGPTIPFYMNYTLNRLQDLGKFKPSHNEYDNEKSHHIDIVTENSHTEQPQFASNTLNSQNIKNNTKNNSKDNTKNNSKDNTKNNSKDNTKNNSKDNTRNNIRYNTRDNMNNMHTINLESGENNFKIKGDLSDFDLDTLEELPNIRQFNQVRDLRNKAIQAQTYYEMQRMGLLDLM